MKYYQLLFFYAYLRHLDLSLDRSRWDSWNDFKHYINNTIQPLSVIEYLKKRFKLSETEDRFVCPRRRKNIIFKRKSLSKKENPFYCYKLISDFEKTLQSDITTYNEDVEKLRITISNYYSKQLEPYILKKDLNKLMKVEHFNQANNINTIHINKFLPKDF